MTNLFQNEDFIAVLAQIAPSTAFLRLSATARSIAFALWDKIDLGAVVSPIRMDYPVVVSNPKTVKDKTLRRWQALLRFVGMMLETVGPVRTLRSFGSVSLLAAFVWNAILFAKTPSDTSSARDLLETSKALNFGKFSWIKIQHIQHRHIIEHCATVGPPDDDKLLISLLSCPQTGFAGKLQSVFRTVCCRGRHRAVKYMLQNANDEIDVSAENNAALRLACKYGHVSTAYVLTCHATFRFDDSFRSILLDCLRWDIPNRRELVRELHRRSLAARSP